MDFNQIIIVGHVGQDPDLKGNSTTSFAQFSVATSEKWKNKETNQEESRTDWHACTAFGKTSEIVMQYVKKGTQVMIIGRQRHNKYKDQDTGEVKFFANINVDRLVLLGSGNGSGTNSARVDATIAGERYAQNPTASNPGGIPPDVSDEDLPF